MESLFFWIDARPRRRLLLRLVSYSLLLWTTFVIIYSGASIFF
jgi:hypothetical protein